MMQQNIFDVAVLGLVAQQDNAVGGIPVWVFLVIALLVVLAGIIWFLVNENKEKSQEQSEVAPVEAQTVEASAPKATEPEAPAKPDDLTVVEGIGPKISATLQAAGITTLAQLGETDDSHIQQILDDAGLSNLADHSTWSEQAKLAANGEWSALEELQNALKGGRRVE